MTLKKGKGSRDANRRAGDLAEGLGIQVLRTFCAVASVPREEDFGLFDAVATLIRQEGRWLHAEDSFLVQFKSRTVSQVEYLDERFISLMNQELSMFIGKVDTRQSLLELYSLAPLMTYLNLPDMKGLVVYFSEVPSDKRITFDGVMHRSLGEPAFRMTLNEMADLKRREKVYEAMKRGLTFDRTNRRQRAIRIQSDISWPTNELPELTCWHIANNPTNFTTELADVATAIKKLQSNVTPQDLRLVAPLLEIIQWLREKGIKYDGDGILLFMTWYAAHQARSAAALQTNPAADLVTEVGGLQQDGSGKFTIRTFSIARTGGGGSKDFVGTVEELREQGIDLEILPDGASNGLPLLLKKWFDSHQHVLLGCLGPLYLSKAVAT